MTPKCIGFASYFLIIMSILLFILTLVASQGINLFHLTTDNLLPFQVQVGLSLLNSVINIAVAVSILNGYRLSRGFWYCWAILYFLINAWQLHNIYYLIPAGAIFLLMIFLLYSKPAQTFFDNKKQQRKKLQGRRVDDTFDIFNQ